jgi:IclR family pca regulon transcriptional regulator
MTPYAAGMDAIDEAGIAQSLVRGLAILAAFDRGRPLRGVSELARELGLTRSTAHRYLTTLLRLGYLDQDPATRRYRLGPRVLDLGLAALESMELREIAAPALRRLTEATGYTTNLAILDGDDVVHIERIRSPAQRHVDLDVHIGSRLPAYCTSLGKALLAFLPDEERRERLAGMRLARLGPHTLTSREALAAELERVRAAGFAVNNEELAPGLRSLAAPVRDRSGHVAAAINVAAHHTLGSLEELVARLAPPLLRTAVEISAAVGYRPARP